MIDIYKYCVYGYLWLGGCFHCGNSHLDIHDITGVIIGINKYPCFCA